MEEMEMNRSDLLDRLSRIRREEAGICTSTCRSVIYSLMAAAWAFWIKDGSSVNHILLLIFLFGSIFLIIDTLICYYVAKRTDKSYKRAKIRVIPTNAIYDDMNQISDFTFRKVLIQIVYCLCLVALFAYYLL